MARALSSIPQWKEPLTICLEGNIGAGKSTLMRQLNELPLVTLFEENLEKWTSVPECDGPSNLLQLFYKKPKRHAAIFQTYGMVTQHANHLATVTTPIKVIERSIYSSFGVFTELLHKQEKLLPVERPVLQHLYSSLKTNTDCTMHCVVYIEVPTSLAAHRISWRGREEERQEGAIDTNYLRQVDEQYEEFFRALPVPIIRVDGCNEPKVILDHVLDRLSELCLFIELPQNANA